MTRFDLFSDTHVHKKVRLCTSETTGCTNSCSSCGIVDPFHLIFHRAVVNNYCCFCEHFFSCAFAWPIWPNRRWQKRHAWFFSFMCTVLKCRFAVALLVRKPQQRRHIQRPSSITVKLLSNVCNINIFLWQLMSMLKHIFLVALFLFNFNHQNTLYDATVHVQYL